MFKRCPNRNLHRFNLAMHAERGVGPGYLQMLQDAERDLRGKPLPQMLRMRLTQAGLFLLLGIMAFALINDVLRIVGG